METPITAGTWNWPRKPVSPVVTVISCWTVCVTPVAIPKKPGSSVPTPETPGSWNSPAVWLI